VSGLLDLKDTDAGELDHNGVPLRGDDGYAFKGERMSAFGTLLQLHGSPGSYPYAAWGDAQAAIHWQHSYQCDICPAHRGSGGR
jgi:hypothetical protein